MSQYADISSQVADIIDRVETKYSAINRAMGLEIKGARNAAGMSAADLARVTGISKGVIDRMTAEDIRDINITQIEIVANAIGVDLVELVKRAERRAAMMSAAAGTNDDLTTRRLQKEAEEMSPAEIESRAIAATEDPERRTDEPPAP